MSPSQQIPDWEQARHRFLLDSGPGGRSVAGANPHTILSLSIDDRPDPFVALEEALSTTPYAMAIAYFTYDLAWCVEDLPVHGRRALAIPDLYVAFYDQITSWTGTPVAAVLPPAPKVAGPPTSSLPEAAYLSAIEEIQRHLVAGDVYQVNLTQRLSVPLAGAVDAYALFRRLRDLNPSCLGAFIDCDRFQVLSNSPERFLSFDADTAVLRSGPIKGTRPVHCDPVKNSAAVHALRTDAKERAEHLMIVDLQRNDLGRVCEPGSVAVDPLMAVETHGHVHHLVSNVRGVRRPDVGLADLLRATFPGGSITGAPKIAAMGLIEALEPVRRQLYCGALGYFTPDGSFDLNLPIRTAVLEDNVIHVHAGGGIVYDSEKNAEYRESWLKTEAFLDALGLDHELSGLRAPAPLATSPPLPDAPDNPNDL